MPSTFTKSGGAEVSFQSGPKNLDFLCGVVALARVYLPRKARRGRISSAKTWGSRVEVGLYLKDWF